LFGSLALLVLVAAGCAKEPDVSSERVVASPASSSTATPKASKTPRGTPASSPSVATQKPTRTTVPAPVATPNLAAARIKLTKIKDLSEPVAMAGRPGDETAYVAEKGGRVRAVRGSATVVTVLDISSEVTNSGEQGLLGLAFSPNGKKMYVYFTNRQTDQVIREYSFSGGRATTSSARTVLEMDDPYGNHNGGNLVFGPDGYLYIGTGDGGSAGDPQNRAQNLDSLLGKMLRIDPAKSGSAAYRSPRTNPYVGRDGRDEIWAYGLRNPWRFSFDRGTGDLWIGDVGQGEWEEIDVASGGGDGGDNYGWRRMEGTHRYGGGTPPAGHHGPVYEFSHEGGNCSVTGGYVYRGTRIPDLRGAYVFADFCVGRLRAFVVRNGSAINHRFLGPQVDSLASFGEGRRGELYVLSLAGGFYRIDPA
jgi:glucose/arabinose dehydrogenase